MKSKAIFGLFAFVSIGLVALSTQSAYAWTDNPSKDPETNKKTYICKVVGTPGEEEFSQTGQNPIQIDRKDEHVIGATFVDAHDGSFVVGYGFAGERQNKQPQLSDCIGMVTPKPRVNIDACVPGIVGTDSVKVKVTNNDQVIGNSVVYTVTVGTETKTSNALADGQAQTLTFNGLAAGEYPVTVSAYGQVLFTTTVTVGSCEGEETDQADISASAICVLEDNKSKFVVTLKNSGDADGEATVNGQVVEVAAGATKTVTIDAGLTLLVKFDGATILDETNQTLKCEGGSGETPVTPETPKTPVTPASSISALPYTSGSITPAVAVGVLSILGLVVAAAGSIKSRLLVS